MRAFFHWLFAERPAPGSWLSVIAWWELRRIPYNLIIGILGLVGLAAFFLFIHLAGELEPGEDAVEPLVILFAPIAINVLYTGGWVAELLLRILWREKSVRTGPIVFKLGLMLSVFVIFLPAALWLSIWLFRMW